MDADEDKNEDIVTSIKECINNNDTSLSIIETPPDADDESIIPLEEALEDGRRMMINFLNNQFDQVVDACAKKSKRSVVFASGLGAIKGAQAVMSMKRQDIEEAINCFKFAMNFAHKMRKKYSYSSFISTYINIFRDAKSFYNSYTDEEAHAELFYAETLIAMSGLCLIYDPSIYGLINTGLRIRSSYSSYKECLNILQYKDNWRTPKNKIHFESGARLGIGGFDLILSMFPQKLAKILEYIGFSSDMRVGLDHLKKASLLTSGIMYEFTAMGLSIYYGFIEYIYGIGEGDVEFFETQCKIWAQKAPNSMIAQIGFALKDQISGNADGAICYYQKCNFNTNSKWKQLRLASLWGVTWCHVMKCDWSAAIECMKIIREDCNISPALFTYLYAVFIHMKMDAETKMASVERLKLLNEISDLLKMVPTLKRTVGGRKSFHEKLCIELSFRFKDNPQDMIIPILEINYIGNIYSMMNGNRTLINPYLDLISDKLDAKKIGDADINKWAHLTFYRGVCYRHLSSFADARNCFDEVLSLKKEISDQDKHLLPQACYELGMMERKLGNASQAKSWFKCARDDYKNHLTQGMINHRTQILLKQFK